MTKKYKRTSKPVISEKALKVEAARAQLREETTGVPEAARGAPGPITYSNAVDEQALDCLKGLHSLPEPSENALTLDSLQALAVEVNGPEAPGFATLYNQLDDLIELYPEKKQFVLAKMAQKSGNEKIARQALRNGLVDIE